MSEVLNINLRLLFFCCLITILTFKPVSNVYADKKARPDFSKYPKSKGVVDWLKGIKGGILEPLPLLGFPEVYGINASQFLIEQESTDSIPKSFPPLIGKPIPLSLFPVDKYRLTDWTEAVREGLIDPIPRTDGKIIDLLLLIKSQKEFMPDVIFPHSAHTYWFDCSNCHPKIFPKKKGATKGMTMWKILKGEYCGRCHGRVAFPLRECYRCHIKRGAPKKRVQSGEFPTTYKAKTVEQEKSDKRLPITLLNRDRAGHIDWEASVRKGLLYTPQSARDPIKDRLMDLVFGVDIVSHNSIHIAWLACKACHPKTFPNKSRQISIEKWEHFQYEYCGKCHNKSVFPLTECFGCHIEEEPWMYDYKNNKTEPLSSRKSTTQFITKPQLPRDVFKRINWPLTLRLGLMNPRSSIDESNDDLSNIKLSPETIYHNSMHQYWLNCDNCHPDIFPMKRGGTFNMTMKKIDNGEFCGRCHGRVAFSLHECKRCHQEKNPEKKSTKNSILDQLPRDRFRSIDWVTANEMGLVAPLGSIDGLSDDEEEETEEIDIHTITGHREGEGRGGKGGTEVLFPHSAHALRLTCGTCHPKIFPKKKDGTQGMNMNKINKGEYCGRCHGKVAFPLRECPRCHPKIQR